MSRTRVDVTRPTFDDDDDRSREQVRADSSQALDRPNPINATTPALVPLLFALAPSLTHSLTHSLTRNSLSRALTIKSN